MMKKLYAVTVTKLDGIEGKTSFDEIIYVRTANIEKFIDEYIENVIKKIDCWWMAYPTDYNRNSPNYGEPKRPKYKEIEFIEA